MNGFKTAVLVVSLVLGGCASVPGGGDAGERGIDGVACVGRVAEVIPGLAASGNPSLVEKTQLASGKGGVCAAKVFAVTAPVVLYRVFDSARPYTKYGGWWSMSRPGTSKTDYRAANAICPEWSNLDRVVACEVRPGTQIVLGTTQSAVCADGSTYAQTAQTQVFVANDGKAGIVHVGACGEEAVWP